MPRVQHVLQWDGSFWTACGGGGGGAIPFGSTAQSAASGYVFRSYSN